MCLFSSKHKIFTFVATSVGNLFLIITIVAIYVKTQFLYNTIVATYVKKFMIHILNPDIYRYT